VFDWDDWLADGDADADAEAELTDGDGERELTDGDGELGDGELLLGPTSGLQDTPLKVYAVGAALVPE